MFECLGNKNFIYFFVQINSCNFYLDRLQTFEHAEAMDYRNAVIGLRDIRRPRPRDDQRKDALIVQCVQSLTQGRFTIAEFIERLHNLYRAPDENMNGRMQV